MGGERASAAAWAAQAGIPVSTLARCQAAAAHVAPAQAPVAFVRMAAPSVHEATTAARLVRAVTVEIGEARVRFERGTPWPDVR